MWIAYVAVVVAVLTVAALARRKKKPPSRGLTLVERHILDRNGQTHREWIAVPKRQKVVARGASAPTQHPAGWAAPPVDGFLGDPDPLSQALVEEAVRRSYDEGTAVPPLPRPDPSPAHHSAPYVAPWPEVTAPDPAPSYDSGPTHESSSGSDFGGGSSDGGGSSGSFD